MSAESGTLKKISKKRRRSSAAAKLAEAKTTTFKDVKQDQKLKEIQRQIRGLAPELKYKDYQHNAVVSYNGTLYDISETVAQGTTDSDRVGDQLMIKGVRLFGHAGATSSANSVLRVIVFIDKADKCTSVSDVLPSAGSLAAVDSQYRHDYFDKRSVGVILADKRLTIGGNATDRQNGLFDMNIKLKYPAQCTFQSGTTTVVRNHLKVILITDQAPTSTLQVVAYFRMFFTDS